jgi:lauroyl/myristoyl acyltransferase
MSTKPRLFGATDLAAVAGLPLLTLLAWATTEGAWQMLGGSMVPLAAPFAGLPAGLAQCIAALLDLQDGAVGGTRILRDMLAHQVEETMQLLACHRPDAWRPSVELRGTDNLLKALATGCGAVLWVGNSAFASLTVKMALHKEGFRLHHLSHPKHGFSASRFGMRWLNPLRTRIEASYLDSRAVLPLHANVGPVLAGLIRRLNDGEVVSVTSGGSSIRPLTVPFLGGSLRLAPGAPGLAQRAGAPLLPVFATREAVDRHIVTIEPPLPAYEGASRDRRLHEQAQAFARRLAVRVQRNPGSWFGWPDSSPLRAAADSSRRAGAAE